MKLFKKRSLKEYIIYTAIIICGIIADQISKALAVQNLKDINTLPLIEDVFHFTYVENRGAAFGMLADQRWLFLIVSSVAIIGFAMYLYMGHSQGRLYTAGITMIISGGIGNMIDRLSLGYVVDFIDCRFVKYPTFSGGEVIFRTFPVFNVADSIVCIGAGLLILALVREIIAEGRAKKK